MVIHGVVNIAKCNLGSKSEGNIAFLIVDENTKYRLYRTNTSDINDHYFQDFDDKQVTVVGEIEDDDYLCVAEIEEDLLTKDNNDEESMY